jgi:hypothetical protein
MKRLIFLAVAACSLSACIDADPKVAQDKEWVDRTYRTGSNIPSKHTASQDGVSTADKDQVDQVMRGSSGYTPSMPAPRPGGGS